MKFEQALPMLRGLKDVHLPSEKWFLRFENGIRLITKRTGSAQQWCPTQGDLLRDDWELYDPPWDGVVPPDPGQGEWMSHLTRLLSDWGRLGWETARRERELRLNASSSNEA